MELCQGIECSHRETCLHYIEYVCEFNDRVKYPLRGGGPWAAHYLCRVDSTKYIQEPTMSKTIWVAVCCDRHEDGDITVYSAREDAIAYAKQFMTDCVSDPTGLFGTDINGRWQMEYAHESDRAFVVPAILN